MKTRKTLIHFIDKEKSALVKIENISCEIDSDIFREIYSGIQRSRFDFSDPFLHIKVLDQSYRIYNNMILRDKLKWVCEKGEKTSDKNEFQLKQLESEKIKIEEEKRNELVQIKESFDRFLIRALNSKSSVEEFNLIQIKEIKDMARLIDSLAT